MIYFVTLYSPDLHYLYSLTVSEQYFICWIARKSSSTRLINISIIPSEPRTDGAKPSIFLHSREEMTKQNTAKPKADETWLFQIAVQSTKQE